MPSGARILEEPCGKCVRGRRAWSTAYVVHGVLVLVVVVLLATIALTARQAPPPTIAEFAPQAVENITDAPADQSSGSGRKGGWGPGGGEATASPDKTQAAVDVPRVKRCVGDPPRQIEDPQSPPCVPYWTGNNGGVTTRGVTGDEIRIAMPSYSETAPWFENFFNKRFEFYGRKIKLLGYAGVASCDESAQRADATGVDETMRVFAASYFQPCFAFSYADELARRKVIYAGIDPNYTRRSAQDRRPYLWQYPMAVDDMFANIGNWVCARLAGGRARFAGDPTYQAKIRTFGIVLRYIAGSSTAYVNANPLKEQLARCGVTPVVEDTAESGWEQSQTVLKLRSQNITSVVCLCEFSDSTVLSKDATAQGYFPEWLLSSYRQLDTNQVVSTWPDKSQSDHAFGLTFVPRQNRQENEPDYWALQEGGRPQGTVKETSGARQAYQYTYRSLLLLASGIQMAGPKLTPETFELGLQATIFPNPDTSLKAGRWVRRNPHDDHRCRAMVVEQPGGVTLRRQRHRLDLLRQPRRAPGPGSVASGRLRPFRAALRQWVCAGINRHGVEDERALWGRSSDPPQPRVMRTHP